MDTDSSSDIYSALAAKEAGHDIKFRTLSWKKATLLLFGEYVCLAILALPWSFSVLGWGVGLVVQIVMGLIAWCELPPARASQFTDDNRHKLCPVAMVHEVS